MTGVGIAWASILSMPYAILAGSLPAERTGIYMGIFNFFIVIPEIVASLCLRLGHAATCSATIAWPRVVAGGAFMLLAAVLIQRVQDVQAR